MKRSIVLTTCLVLSLWSCQKIDLELPILGKQESLFLSTIRLPLSWKRVNIQCYEQCAKLVGHKEEIFVDYGPFAFSSVDQVIKDARKDPQVERITTFYILDYRVPTRSVLIRYKPINGKKRNGLFIERRKPASPGNLNSVVLYGTYSTIDWDLLQIYRTFRFNP